MLCCYDAAYSIEWHRYRILMQDCSRAHATARNKAPTPEYGLALAESFGGATLSPVSADRLSIGGEPIPSSEAITHYVAPAMKGKSDVRHGRRDNANPAVDSDGTIYIGSRDNNLYALNPDGSVKWSFAAARGFNSFPAISTDGTIYVGAIDGKLYALNPDGTLQWSFTTAGEINSGSLAIAPDGKSLHRCRQCRPQAVRYQLRWLSKVSFATGDWIQGSPSIAVDGTVYVGSIDNHL